jgi:hypothetical protein
MIWPPPSADRINRATYLSGCHHQLKEHRGFVSPLALPTEHWPQAPEHLPVPRRLLPVQPSYAQQCRGCWRTHRGRTSAHNCS